MKQLIIVAVVSGLISEFLILWYVIYVIATFKKKNIRSEPVFYFGSLKGFNLSNFQQSEGRKTREAYPGNAGQNPSFYASTNNAREYLITPELRQNYEADCDLFLNVAKGCKTAAEYSHLKRLLEQYDDAYSVFENWEIQCATWKHTAKINILEHGFSGPDKIRTQTTDPAANVSYSNEVYRNLQGCNSEFIRDFTNVESLAKNIKTASDALAFGKGITRFEKKYDGRAGIFGFLQYLFVIAESAANT